MKKILALVCMITALWSCSQDELNSDSKSALRQFTVNATLESDSTLSRASLADGNSVVWNEGDAISFFDIEEAGYGSKMTLSSGAGTTNGCFVGSSSTSSAGYFAVYPYNEKSFNGDGRPYIVWNGSEQIARKGSIPEGTPMAAYIDAPSDETSSIDLQFKNITGYVKVTIGYKCKCVTVTSHNSDEYISADKIILSKNYVSSGYYSSNYAGHNSVTLSGKDGGSITPGTYYIAVLPGTCFDGLDITFTSANDDTRTYTKSTDNKVVFKRNTILNFGTIDITSLMGFKGKGTSDDPYLIEDFWDLQAMQKLIADGTSAPSGCQSYINAYYKQVKNIDCDGQTLIPIGIVNKKYFAGTYDGGNHSISNVVYEPRRYSGFSYGNYVSALFGAIKQATIKDLNVENASMVAYPTKDADRDILSPFVAFTCCDEGKSCTISNCHAYSDQLKTTETTIEYCVCYGGIVAENSANLTMTNCSSNVNVKFSPAASSTSLLYNIGGIVGDCLSWSSRPDGERSGHEETLRLTNCRNSGCITAAGYWFFELNLGGILGYVRDAVCYGDVCATIVSCVNSGNVRAEDDKEFYQESADHGNYIGGIVGYMDSDGYGSSDPYIINCLNKGDLSCTKGDLKCGGIVGRCYNSDTHIQYCVNAGNLSCTTSKAIWGDNYRWLSYPSVSNCYTTTNCSTNSNCTYKSDLTPDNMNSLIGGKYTMWIYKNGMLDLDF